MKRVFREGLRLKPDQPCFDQRQNLREIELLMNAGILAEIGLGEFEQGGRRTQPFLLEMDIRACQLDQTFVKISIGPVAVGEPEFLQNIMSFIKLLPIETIKIPQVMRVVTGPGKSRDPFGDFSALFAHSPSLTRPPKRPKPKASPGVKFSRAFKLGDS